MDWGNLEYFLAVAGTGSLSGAARQLRVNHSTVARRLDKLEQQLQVRLFDRLNNGYQLTEAGLALKKQATPVEQQINQIEGVFSGSESELSGRLRVSKPSSGALNLAPLLADFLQLYPHIDIELSAAGTLAEMNRMEADVAVRLTDNPPENLVGRKLGQLPYKIYGSRAYLERVSSRDPAACDWLVWQGDASTLSMEPSLQRDLPDARIVFRTNSYNELYEAVKAGVGVSFLSPLRLPHNHRLQELSPELYRFEIGVWLLSHPDLRNRQRIRVFKDFMVEQLGGILAQYWKTTPAA